MRDTNIQWHPGFVGAMNLELRKNRDDLLFEKEYNLNTKPLEIDLLVIRKNTDIQIDNEIGKMFLGHNILEYKSGRQNQMGCSVILRNMAIRYQTLTTGYIILKEKCCFRHRLL